MDQGPRPARGLEPEADLGALDRVDGAEGLRQETVELAVPLNVRTEPDRTAERHHLEHAAERVTGGFCLVDGLDHGALGARIGAPHLRGLRALPDLLPGQLEPSDADAADLRHVAQDRDPELGEQTPGDAGDRDPRRGLARARALENIADVVMAVLHGAGEIGVAGSRAGHRLGGRAGGRGAHGHGALPVIPVAVLDREGDRATKGQAPPDACGEMSLIALDLHAAAAPVPALAAREVLVDVVFGQGEA